VAVDVHNRLLGGDQHATDRRRHWQQTAGAERRVGEPQRGALERAARVGEERVAGDVTRRRLVLVEHGELRRGVGGRVQKATSNTSSSSRRTSNGVLSAPVRGSTGSTLTMPS
jgi:hypothetical protein